MRAWLSSLGLVGVGMFLGFETFVASLVAIAVLWVWNTRRRDRSDSSGT